MNVTAPTVETMPDLEFVTADGKQTTLYALLPATGAVLYFMRASTCAVCTQHAKRLARAADAGRLGTTGVIVVVPGGKAEAQLVARKVFSPHVTVVAGDESHIVAGLEVSWGLQRSGTVVVDGQRTITYERVATLPTGAYSEAETVDAALALAR